MGVIQLCECQDPSLGPDCGGALGVAPCDKQAWASPACQVERGLYASEVLDPRLLERCAWQQCVCWG